MSKSNTYAIIQLVGKQFKVSEGDTITVDRLPYAEGESFDVSDVLLVVNGEDINIGQPLVEKTKVTLKVVSHGRGEKIRVATYKAKSRSRKVQGHRQEQTTVEVVKIK